MYIYQSIIVLIHVLAAIVWLGGMFFIALVLVPALRKFKPLEKRTEILSLSGIRFRWVSWIAILIILITGVINSANHGITLQIISSGQLLSSHFGKILTLKVFLVFAMIIISAIHDFILGPRFIELMKNNKERHEEIMEIARKRQNVSWLARFNAFLGILVVACAIMLS